jgi:polyphosphate glucokinase
MLTDRVRVRTPYPCPPELMINTLTALVAPLPAYDRVAVGFPGMVRDGRVLSTPHYVTEAGPFTPARPDLVDAWAKYDIQTTLAEALGVPTRVVNDAEMHGVAVICGDGFEIVLTLGTGVGFAMFNRGQILPKVELSQHPLRKRQTYDEQLGDIARREIGNRRWSKRVVDAVGIVQNVFWPDRLYLGGGNARHVLLDLGPDVTIVANTAGLLGGVRIWDVPRP